MTFFCSLTLRPPDRAELCEGLILDESLFQRLFLHWNSGCRGFFIRLVSASDATGSWCLFTDRPCAYASSSGASLA